MGTFFLVLAFLIFAGVFAGMLGSVGGFIFMGLLATGVITAILKAWFRLNERLDRIEKALGIEKLPEEMQDGERMDASDHIEKPTDIVEPLEGMQDGEWRDASDDPPSPSD